MTKVTILGQEPKEEKKLKPIEFKYWLDYDKIELQRPLHVSPSRWNNIELIKKGVGDNLDIMYGYDDDRNLGVLYLGHFNDGVVE